MCICSARPDSTGPPACMINLPSTRPSMETAKVAFVAQEKMTLSFLTAPVVALRGVNPSPYMYYFDFDDHHGVCDAVLSGKADAGAIGSPVWSGVHAQALVPEGSLTEVWTSPPYSHCMFTARPGLDDDIGRRFAEALSKMSFDSP